MTKHQLLLLCLLSIVVPLITNSARADENSPCAAEYAQIVGEFPRWSFTNGNLELTPEQILPADYLASLKEKFGEVKIRKYTYQNTELGFQLYAGNSNYPFMRWKFYRDPAHPEDLRIDELRLESPESIAPAPLQLHISQNKKGLPLKVFAHARRQLLSLARAGGYKRLTSHGAQNYAVLMLYRRMVGLDAADEQGREMMKYLDKLFDYSKTSLPEEFRVTTLDDFSRILGDYTTESVTLKAKNEWKQYQETHQLPAGLELLKDDQGETVGFIDKAPQPTGAKPAVYFVDRLNPSHPILQWKELSHNELKAGLKMSLENSR